MGTVRMWGTLLAGATVAGMVMPSGMAQAKTVTLAPYTAWNVDYGDKICTLRRGFGSKEKPGMMIIHRFGPTASFQLTMVGEEFKSFEQGMTLFLKFGEQKPRRKVSVVPSVRTSVGKALFFANVSLAEDIPGKHDEDDEELPVSPAIEAATKSITISYYGTDRVFQTGPLDKPFAALRKCTDNLVASWGLDPHQQATLSQRARPITRPGRWITSSDYPREMLNVGKQALVNFRLSVDAQGMPTACEIQSSYNDKKFDDASCAVLMRRARFSPALDAKGVAVPSYYLNTVRWVMQY